MPLRLHNTLTRRVEEFVPGDPDRVTFYSCGPTVYDDAHIGNFRSFLAADVLRRFVESPLCELALAGGKVHAGPRTLVHVMNITDVGHMTDDAEGGEAGEDRMAVAGRRIAEAKKSGKLPADVKIDPNDPYQIARFYEGRFREDARRLGLKVAIEAETHPGRMPKATQNIAGMIAVIERLIGRGHAYVSGAPGERVVYFRVKSFGPYGRLSGNTLDSLREGEGGRVSTVNQSTKEHPADFLLWKEDPRHIMKWDSPWGPGYPGWHIECTVMSAEGTEASRHQGLKDFKVLGGESVIDLHSGGEDNIFPHHECEIAQSCCAFNEAPERGSFARMWFHPRFLLVEGTKMSKSKGNFFTARDLFAKGVEPGALRLELVKTHYRSNANFTMQGLADSQRVLDRWRRFVEAGLKTPERERGGPKEGARDAARAEFAGAMHEDLNVAAAIAALNTFVSETGGSGGPDAADAHVVQEFDTVLGVLGLERAGAAQTDIGVFVGGLAPDPAVIAKLEERRSARASRDFKRSDEIRDELLAMGYGIKDAPGGKVEVSRVVK
jgi:cysteinyl-tRNA synthetase